MLNLFGFAAFHEQHLKIKYIDPEINLGRQK
ncbi:MAG: hypothetical protein DGJ47_000254 [Rickettsiaceae bacterium]